MVVVLVWFKDSVGNCDLNPVPTCIKKTSFEKKMLRQYEVDEA